MLSRRRLLAISSAAIFVSPTQSAAHPLAWVVRGLLKSGTRGATRRNLGTVARSTGSATARASTATASGRAAASIRNVVPYAARNPRSRAKAIEILTLFATTVGAVSAVTSRPVYAAVQRTEPDSPMMATVAYYALLKENDREAQLAMWVDPDVGRHFQNVGRIQGYEIVRLATTFNDQFTATTEVGVYAKNYGEPRKYYFLDIHWVNTDYGWLIAGQSSK